MPGSRLMEAEFGNELVHLGIELDYHPVGIIVVTGNVVARRVARGAPKADLSRLHEGCPPLPHDMRCL